VATRFSDDARTILAPIMSDDLSTYLSGVGEMFREVEQYARADDGPVYLGPLTPPMTAAAISHPLEPFGWWAYYALGTRVTKTWDTSVTIGGLPTARINRLVNDADAVGLASSNNPVKPGDRIAWRGAIKGVPGRTYQLSLNFFELLNAAGGSTGNVVNVPTSTEGGITEFALEATVPANRFYAWPYVLDDGLPGATPFWVSSESALYRRSTSSLPVSPWAKTLDPEAAINEAALLYLAQLAGVRVPQGMAFRDMQSFIERAEARRRGRLDYMVDLAKSTLTGSKLVFTIERADGSAWKIRMVTRLSETPDPAATEEAILRGKPSGIVLDYEAVTGITWDEALTRQWNQSALTWDESADTVP
jgi:hypothetical protein